MARWRGPAGGRWEPSDRVGAGQGAAKLDEAGPEAVAKLGHQVWRPIFTLIDRGAGPMLIGQGRDVVTDVDGELPIAVVHGGLLHLGVGDCWPVGRVA